MTDGTIHAAIEVVRVELRRVSKRYNLLPALTALDNVIAPVLPCRTGWDNQGHARRRSPEGTGVLG